MAEVSKNETGGGEGIEVLKNEPFKDFPLLGKFQFYLLVIGYNMYTVRHKTNLRCDPHPCTNRTCNI